METSLNNLKSLTNHTPISQKLPTSGKKWNGTEKTDYFSTTEVECHMILCYLVALKLRL